MISATCRFLWQPLTGVPEREIERWAECSSTLSACFVGLNVRGGALDRVAVCNTRGRVYVQRKITVPIFYHRFSAVCRLFIDFCFLSLVGLVVITNLLLFSVNVRCTYSGALKRHSSLNFISHSLISPQIILPSRRYAVCVTVCVRMVLCSQVGVISIGLNRSSCFLTMRLHWTRLYAALCGLSGISKVRLLVSGTLPQTLNFSNGISIVASVVNLVQPMSHRPGKAVNASKVDLLLQQRLIGGQQFRNPYCCMWQRPC